MEKTDQDLKKLFKNRSHIVKKTRSFGMEIETNRSNAETKSKNLGFLKKLYNLVTSLLPVLQGKNKVKNIVL